MRRSNPLSATSFLIHLSHTSLAPFPRYLHLTVVYWLSLAAHIINYLTTGHGAFPAADWSGLHLFSDQWVPISAMASPLLTYLENFHWKGYRVDTIVDHSNTMMCLHRGNFPMHRYCRNVNIGCTLFNLMEAWDVFIRCSSMRQMMSTCKPG